MLADLLLTIPRVVLHLNGFGAEFDSILPLCQFFNLTWKTSHVEFFVCTNESGQKMLLNAIRYFISRPISKIEFNIIKSTKQKMNPMEEDQTKGSARQGSIAFMTTFPSTSIRT